MFMASFWASVRRTGLCGLGLAAAGFWLPIGSQAAAPATSTVVTTAVTASYALPGGTTEISQSNMASFVLGRAAGITVQPLAKTQTVAAGQTVCTFPLLIQNTGDGSDLFAVSLDVPQGWSATLVRDSNGNGQYQATETARLTLPLALNTGQSVHCFLRVTQPGMLVTGGTVSACVTSQTDTARSAVFTGTLSVPAAAPDVPADTLSLAWMVQTGGPALGEATVQDGTAYVGSDDGFLYALAATSESGDIPGTILWRQDTHGRVRCAPAVYTSPAGRQQVSVGNDMGMLTTWDAATGQPLWAAFVGLGHGMSWQSRPLVSADGSTVTVPGEGGFLVSFDTINGCVRRHIPWRDMVLAGNPTSLDSDGGAWLMGTNGWGTYVRGGLPGRRMWLGGRAAGAWALDTAQNRLLGVTAAGHVAACALSPVSSSAPTTNTDGIDLGVSVTASPALDTTSGFLYVAAADHVVYAVSTAGSLAAMPSRLFAPGGAPGATFRAAPLVWPSLDGGASTLYVGGTDGEFYAVPTDLPGSACAFTPAADSELGEWDAAPVASGTGPQDVIVVGNSNGIIYGFCLR